MKGPVSRAGRARAGVACVALALAAPACAGPDPAARGDTSVPVRIVSLVPSVTDWIVALGLAERLVGRTDYDTAAALRHLPSVGGTINPSVELLVRLDPDLVLTWPGASDPALARQLAGLGIVARAVSAETIQDLRDALRDLGQLFGLPDSAAAWLRRLDAGLGAVHRRVADRTAVRVLYVVSVSPPMTTGPGTFVDEILSVAGGTNIFGDAPVNWPTVTVEAIVARRPDVIVWPLGLGGAADVAGVRRLPGWREIPAVRAGRVAFVDGALLGRPGPRLLTAAERLADLLHE